VLNCARDAAGDIQLGTDCLSCLPDLMRVTNPARVNRGTGSADCCAEDLRKLSDRFEALRSANAASAGNDDFCALEVNNLTCGFFYDFKKLGADSFGCNMEISLMTSAVRASSATAFLKTPGRTVPDLGTVVRAENGSHEVAAEGGTGPCDISRLFVNGK